MRRTGRSTGVSPPTCGAHCPTAASLGFTGTPIDKKDRSTFQTFGDYIHTYTIEQAVQDGATVPIFYEMRQSPERLEGESIDSLFDRIFRDRSDEERERIKTQYVTAEAIAGAPRGSRPSAWTSSSTSRSSSTRTASRRRSSRAAADVAVSYKETLDRLGAPESAIVMSSTHNDPERLAKWKTSKERTAEADRAIQGRRRPARHPRGLRHAAYRL